MSKVTMRDMFSAGVHFGHRKRFWNPKMAPYIHSARNDIHIIDLDKTLPMFNDAVNFIGKLAANGAKVLFVGTKWPASKIIKAHAQRCNMPYVDHRWLGGMLTNYKTVRQSVKRLLELEKLKESPKWNKMIKKEALKLDRELSKLQQSLGGIKDIAGIPDVLFVVDVGYEKIAVTEANKLKIPVVGVVDTNNIPDNIDYIIPGNDDSMKAIELYVSTIADAILEAKSAAGVMEEEKIEEYVEVSTESKISDSDKPEIKTKVSIKGKQKSSDVSELETDSSVPINVDSKSSGAEKVKPSDTVESKADDSEGK